MSNSAQDAGSGPFVDQAVEHLSAEELRAESARMEEELEVARLRRGILNGRKELEDLKSPGSTWRKPGNSRGEETPRSGTYVRAGWLLFGIHRVQEYTDCRSQ